MSFKEIFGEIYGEIVSETGKPVIISEFSSAESGGDKALWIKEAMTDIRSWRDIKAFVLFNVDKETDWNFPVEEASGIAFREQLKKSYFRGTVQ